MGTHLRAFQNQRKQQKRGHAQKNGETPQDTNCRLCLGLHSEPERLPQCAVAMLTTFHNYPRVLQSTSLALRRTGWALANMASFSILKLADHKCMQMQKNGPPFSVALHISQLIPNAQGHRIHITSHELTACYINPKANATGRHQPSSSVDRHKGIGAAACSATASV